MSSDQTIIGQTIVGRITTGEWHSNLNSLNVATGRVYDGFSVEDFREFKANLPKNIMPEILAYIKKSMYKFIRFHPNATSYTITSDNKHIGRYIHWKSEMPSKIVDELRLRGFNATYSSGINSITINF